MIIEYNVDCFERTLVIKCDNAYDEHKEDILAILDAAYDAWHNPEDIEDEDERDWVENDACCEEYMMSKVQESYPGLNEDSWNSFYYGDNREEIAEDEEENKYSLYKCKICGHPIGFYSEDFNYWGEEMLWGHIQMQHEDKFEEVQNWETPDMIEECYEEGM